MSDSPTQFALREVRRHYSSAKMLGMLMGIAVILGISGPFGTGGFMRPGPLVVYWIIIVYTTFAAGTFVGSWSSQYFRAHNRSQILSIAVTSIGTGAVTILIVIGVNWAALGLAPTTPNYLGSLVVTTFATAAIIAVILFYTGVNKDQTTEPLPSGPHILDRLPLEKRGALISMSVSDHYVEVTTTKGQELVLIRLADAMRETDGVKGMQVHRSHWVSLTHVKAAKRAGDRAILTMSDGRDIPVSRSYVPSVKDAGLLPR